MRTLEGRIARGDPAPRKQLLQAAPKAARKSAPNAHYWQSFCDNDEPPASAPDSDTEEDDDAPPEIGGTDVDDIADPADLRAHLKDALDLINKHVDLASHPAGALQPLLSSRPGYAKSMAAQIRRRMGAKYLSLSKRQKERSGLEVTSDDFSSVMEDFLPEIEALSRLPDPASVELSYDLAMELMGKSYGDLDAHHGSDYGARPSDEPCDQLLVRILRKRPALGQSWDWQGNLKNLDWTSEHLDAYGIETWYPRTRRVLRKQLGFPINLGS